MKRIFIFGKKPGYGESGSCMYREGDFVILEYQDFDVEDNRAYGYVGKFRKEYFERAVKTLKASGRARLTTLGSGFLTMTQDNGLVKLKFQI